MPGTHPLFIPVLRNAGIFENCEPLRLRLGGLLRRLGLSVVFSSLLASAGAADVEAFAALAQEQQWNEQWPDDKGGELTVAVSAKVWNTAIQAALTSAGSVHLPARGQPYYLDGPIILKSGQKLTAEPASNREH